MQVISIGDLVLDYYYKDGKLVGVDGGMSSHNIIANLAKMGFDTKVFGVAGDDIQGQTAINRLSELSVNTDDIIIIPNIKTRCFHVSYFEDENGKLTFISKKRCPFCQMKKWYDESLIDVPKIKKKLKNDDVLVFDNLNNQNQKLIDETKNKKMLDLGQYFELEKMTDKDLINNIKDKFLIINLNERVEKYLIKRFNLKNLLDVYDLLKPSLIIVTRGKKGADFAYDNKLLNQELSDPKQEKDSTGAGDAFFSVFIGEVINNEFNIDEQFIEKTFTKAIKLTKKVVTSFGARGHLNKLLKIKKTNQCTCEDFVLAIRKQIKRSNVNVNNLKKRVMNAINSDAVNDIKKVNINKNDNCLFVGTGGSYAAAVFSSRVINQVLGCNTYSLLPRDILYRNNDRITKVIMFSYSGTTHDIIDSTKNFFNKDKYLVTKGEIQKIVEKTNFNKNNIISYRTSTNKGKERGFLSFEGALVPAAIFLKSYYKVTSYFNCDEFIEKSLDYWNDYFGPSFINEYKDIFKKVSHINIFAGDNTNSGVIDLESKIIESGVYNCTIHEKKNFSHGRFINYENLNNNFSIFFKQKTTSKYEKELLKYLELGSNIIIESKFDGILGEFDLLVASQFLINAISKMIDIDLSKPDYTENAMKIYFYKDNIL